MAYQPVRGPHIQGFTPAHLDNIELDTRYDPGTYKYAPPPGHPPSQISNQDSKVDDDKKPFFRSASKSSQPPGSNWPVQSQQVATVTLLRAGLMIFDAILASTPIMFVGESIIRSNAVVDDDCIRQPTYTLVFSSTVYILQLPDFSRYLQV
jgi:hypothetical protein